MDSGYQEMPVVPSDCTEPPVIDGYQRVSEVSRRCRIIKIPVTRQAGVSNGHIASFCEVVVSRKKYIRLGRLCVRFKFVVGRARTNLFRFASRKLPRSIFVRIFQEVCGMRKGLLILSAFTSGLLT